MKKMFVVLLAAVLVNLLAVPAWAQEQSTLVSAPGSKEFLAAHGVAVDFSTDRATVIFSCPWWQVGLVASGKVVIAPVRNGSVEVTITRFHTGASRFQRKLVIDVVRLVALPDQPGAMEVVPVEHKELTAR